MPTVILLDVSLSMFRPLLTLDPTDTPTRLVIAATAINSFLDFLSVHVSLEFVAFATFSSVCDVVVPFTRDFDVIRNKLLHLEEGDKTCLEAALAGVSQLVLSEWGYQTPVQIVIVTDGNVGMGPLGRNKVIPALPLPVPFPVRVHVIPIAAPTEACLVQAMPLYQKIVDIATLPNHSSGSVSKGGIYCLDQLSVSGAIMAVSRMCEQHFQEYCCTLKCGAHESRVQLFPEPHAAVHEGTAAIYTLSDELHVIGFLHQNELVCSTSGTPISVSKHLVIPHVPGGNTPNSYGSKTSTKDSSSSMDSGSPDEEMSEPSKSPNICVLLHGALKVESMVAIVELAPDWWGALVAWCEPSRSSRRSCLLLCLMRPGAGAVPWLGPLDQLGSLDDDDLPSTAEEFPVRLWRSYSAGNTACAWTRPHALFADVQKVLRHARKLPDKTQHLYKELNRLRRSALSLGFSELILCVGNALERECAALPSSAPSEAALQLAHAAGALRNPHTAFDPKQSIFCLPPAYTLTPM